MDGILVGSIKLFPYFNFNLDLNLSSINVSDLITDCVNLYMPEYVNQGVELSFEIEEKVPGNVQTDFFVIKESLSPLLDNGLKFGGGKRVLEQKYEAEECEQCETSPTGITTA